MEKIISITEYEEKANWHYMGGYRITTEVQEIKLLIDTQQDCCERAGYFMSGDVFSEYVGANLLSIELTDTALNSVDFTAHELDGKYFEGGIMFVTLETSAGPLQFVAYNEHNGYYGHDAVVISTQLTHEETL